VVENGEVVQWVKYMNKLEIAKKFLKDRTEAKEMWQEQLFNADKKYIGKTLEAREKELRNWINETKVEIEMAEKYIYEIEMQNKQGEEHDAEEAKAEELRNQVNSENVHSD
jgi:hypothetical protein